MCPTLKAQTELWLRVFVGQRRIPLFPLDFCLRHQQQVHQRPTPLPRTMRRCRPCTAHVRCFLTICPRRSNSEDARPPDGAALDGVLVVSTTNENEGEDIKLVAEPQRRRAGSDSNINVISPVGRPRSETAEDLFGPNAPRCAVVIVWVDPSSVLQRGHCAGPVFFV